MDDSVAVAAELERLRLELENRDRVAMRMAAKARRLEDAIALHRRRKSGEADDVAFLDPADIDALLWQELEPTDERHLLDSA
ncbi:MAG TPA: hypothetical protein VNU01_02765 [Egibacteraceae bacterium]|nr:hypothetical protein [Egibacteraceae bacterium]